VRFGDLPDLGGSFSFQGGRFCRLKSTKILADSKNENKAIVNICHFGTKLFDALSNPWFVAKVIKHKI